MTYLLFSVLADDAVAGCVISCSDRQSHSCDGLKDADVYERLAAVAGPGVRCVVIEKEADEWQLGQQNSACVTFAMGVGDVKDEARTWLGAAREELAAGVASSAAAPGDAQDAVTGRVVSARLALRVADERVVSLPALIAAMPADCGDLQLQMKLQKLAYDYGGQVTALRDEIDALARELPEGHAAANDAAAPAAAPIVLDPGMVEASSQAYVGKVIQARMLVASALPKGAAKVYGCGPGDTAFLLAAAPPASIKVPWTACAAGDAALTLAGLKRDAAVTVQGTFDRSANKMAKSWQLMGVTVVE